MNQQRLARIIFGVILLLSASVVLGVSGYLVKNRPSEFLLPIPSLNPSSTPELTLAPSPTPDQTADWSIYRNEKFGFEFRYPKNFKVKENIFDASGKDWDGSGIKKLAIFDLFDSNDEGPIVNPSLRLSVASESYEAVVKRYKEMEKISIGDNYKEKQEEVSIGGFKGVRLNKYVVVSVKNHSFIFDPTWAVGTSVLDQILPTFKFTDKNTAAEIDDYYKKTGEQMLCDQSNFNGDSCYGFVSSLFQEPVPSDIVNSDDKLKEYFLKKLEQLSLNLDISFTGISRGKFDKFSDEDNIIISFETSLGKHFDDFVMVLHKDADGFWRTTYQNIGYFQDFSNNPQEIVKGEPKFFIGRSTPMGGTCVGVEWSTIIYRLENNDFKPIWRTIDFIDQRIYEGKEPTNHIEALRVGIDYKDLDGDGNLEITKKGNKSVCESKEGCYSSDCEKIIKEEKISETYKWNKQEQTFLKNN